MDELAGRFDCNILPQAFRLRNARPRSRPASVRRPWTNSRTAAI